MEESEESKLSKINQVQVSEVGHRSDTTRSEDAVTFNLPWKEGHKSTAWCGTLESASDNKREEHLREGRASTGDNHNHIGDVDGNHKSISFLLKQKI